MRDSSQCSFGIHLDNTGHIFTTLDSQLNKYEFMSVLFFLLPCCVHTTSLVLSEGDITKLRLLSCKCFNQEPVAVAIYKSSILTLWTGRLGQGLGWGGGGVLFHFYRAAGGHLNLAMNHLLIRLGD